MSKQTLVFNDIEVNKKYFYASKKVIPLNVNHLIISKRLKNNNDTYKYFIGYNYEDKIRLFYIVLPQIIGYIKYFENGSRNISFKMKLKLKVC